MSRSMVFLVLSALITYVTAQSQPCSGKYCIEGQAQCINDSCVCNNPPYTHGDGYFNCYRKSQIAAEILNDPVLNTFGNESDSLTVPCRILVVNTKLELKRYVGKPTNIGFCYVQVHSFQSRSRGKFYVSGYEVAIKLEYSYGTVKNVSSIVFGPQGGVQENGTDNAFLPDGPYANDNVDYNDTANNVRITRYYDSNNDQYVFEADACGIRATLVPYDTVSGLDRVRVPGVSVAINCIHHPKYFDIANSVGIIPKSSGGYTLQDIQSFYPGTTVEQALSVFAFTRNTTQTQPYVSTECPLVKSSLLSCDSTNLPVAVNKCDFIFKSPKFVDCISGAGSSTSVPLQLYRACVDNYCGASNQCATIQGIVGTCTVNTGPQLTTLLAEACAP
ncbi:uncharacterized protein LOC106059749 [Biomphalaria glabrata]|uniref:Uncharacterized protein LOC106059749 n=1 Tax=Biomphalaria glabrata TaxID=6526 RepID=A0A9W3BNA6_BIOGL|nr:uncharacterized protein LOC106059749 [Biomphalaria glabrata]